MRPLLAIAIACLLAGCNTVVEQVNACLPAAIAAKGIMERNGVPTKVLVVRWKENNRTRGHAYAIFRYGKKWSYDKDFGSIALDAEIGANLDPAEWEAWEANWKRGHKGTIVEAYYLEEDQA
jgi:hypothetical protein